MCALFGTNVLGYLLNVEFVSYHFPINSFHETDSEFALRLEPNNQELKKLYSEAKALYDKVNDILFLLHI